MKIAITGGTGFIGKHLAQDLVERGHQVVVISRGLYSRGQGPLPHDDISYIRANVTDTSELTRAFTGCTAVVHCAGTSEDKSQTFQQVHVEGARSAITAAQQAGVQKFVLLSYLHARPNIRSAYHTTKWEGEEIVRQSGLNYTILKAGLVYGQGDHLLSNLGNLLGKLPVFATVGVHEKTVRLVAVEDLVNVIHAALTDDRLSRKTVAVLGPEEFPFSIAARRIAKTMGRPSLVVLPFPVFAQRLLAWVSGWMPKPLISASQVQMLAEGISTPLPDSLALPEELAPKINFTEEQIRKGLPS
ncbi:MAG TPA: NAD(P)H-binding protein [Anaerolineales bacterium]|nr:NAD(P)H-binding protein [Anaerolineales bacterium]HLO32974.1 NAD(P)H-binding protein [Anaerolineales bacterium]